MNRPFPWQLELLGLLLVGAIVLVANRVRAVDSKAEAPASQFVQPTIDVGCFVSDPDASVKFYTEAIGFKEVSPFSVAGDFCKRVGLTDGAPLNRIRVLVLGDGPGATKLKLSSIPGKQARPGDKEYVSSQYGYRYLSIFVSDLDAALARLKKAGVKPLAQGPAEIPKDIAEGVSLACVRDPDGNIIELLGPKK
jgi:catechol 2,3-dioxygenase-like lactoylglutathione lyase family enzyme